jgi:hypothetical protein
VKSPETIQRKDEHTREKGGEETSFLAESDQILLLDVVDLTEASGVFLVIFHFGDLAIDPMISLVEGEIIDKGTRADLDFNQTDMSREKRFYDWHRDVDMNSMVFVM